MRFWVDEAWLPDGWARDVAFTLEGAAIGAVTPGRREGTHLPGRAVPGMPNLHSHTFQRAMAGLAERRGPAADSFWTWREVMYGFLAKLTPDDVQAIAAQAMMEMLEGGFTHLAEFHYLHHAPDGAPYADPAEMAVRIGAAAEEAGIGLTMLPVLYSHGGFGAQPPSPGQRRFLNGTDSYLRLLERTRAALPDAVVGVAPHSLRAATAAQITEVLRASPAGPVHIHVAEQVAEVEQCLAWCGQRPVRHLLDTQPVDARWCLVHATQMLPEETAALSATGAVAGLCPITEANLGDGIFDALRFTGPWGVGSDSNVEITAPGELRMLEYGQRLLHRGRNLLARGEGRSTGEDLWRAALAGGARACGIATPVLAPGARADIAWLDGTPDEAIFAAAPVTRVMAAGRVVVEAGRHARREAIAARFRRVLERLRG